MIPPDNRGFHASVCRYDGKKYICIYHNSENHRLASCFLDEDLNFLIDSHTQDLGISYNIDPRLIKYGEKFYMSTSQLRSPPDFIELYELSVSDKITVIHNSKISFINGINGIPESYHTKSEKNWTPWIYDNKFMYTYTLNPHKIVEVNIDNKNAKLVVSTSWKYNGWWENQNWVYPKYRLNCPPLYLNNGMYLYIFHTMKMMPLDTPWHQIIPNNLRCY